MHEVVTNSSASSTNFLSANSDDLTTPVSRNNRQHTADNFHWSQVHDFGTDSTIESHQNWHLSAPNDDPSAHLTPIHRSTPASLHKIPSGMPSRTENNTSDRNNHRWRFNTNGQLVDSEAAGWDLADEIVRLKIGETAADSDGIHGHIPTPPKSKLPAAVATQLTETSPLETSSNTSVGSSPHTPEHRITTHSRGSSTDTTVSSSQDSVVSAAASNTMLAKPPLKVNIGTEVKERPHSFSGGLSSAELRRLQQAGDGSEAGDRQLQQQWMQYRENQSSNTEQLSYPSLATHIHRPQPQLHPQMYDYRGGNSQLNETPAPNRDDAHVDYNTQQRNFNTIPQGLNIATSAAGPAFVQGRPNNAVPGVTYRQPPRGFPQQGPVPSPSAMSYPGGHVSHLSLGNTQQLYEMMMPGIEGHHPAVTRVQQQHNIFRPTHHHSASDPSAIRDAAALALLNSNMPPFAPGMFQPGMPLPMYPNQYFGAQEQYPLPDAAVMAARLQAQYTGPYAVLPPQVGQGSAVSSPTSTNGPGPSANNRKLGLYKTELCRSWEEKGSCRYGTKCQFAHGEEELRNVSRHPKYKTEICRTFWVSGSCPYGKRCCFIHTELPTSGATAATTSSGTPATDSAPPQQRPDGRARSLSTNSDPNEANVSILARISAKRGQDSNNLPTPTDSATAFQFTRPPTGSLRVDTSTIDASVKQNKSAYPAFASNGILLPAPEPVRPKSPGPVTAGPDLGRHNNSRREIVGYNNQQQQQQQRTHKTNDSSSSSVRQSVNGSDADAGFNASSPPASGHSSYVLSSEGGRVNGHHRAGSAGNWGSFSRNNHLATSAYPHGQSPASEGVVNSPWVQNDIQGVGTSRLHEKVWV